MKENNINFLNDVHYYLRDEFYDEGVEIITNGESCDSLIFVVKGLIELKIVDNDANYHTLEVLS